MRVLLASDDSSEAREAILWLRDLALPPDTTVCVVTVATLMEPPPDSRSLRALRQTIRTEAGRAAEHAATLLKERWPGVETVVAEGDARVEILHVAEERRADLVVLGARGLGRVQRLLGGSTSLAVARYAPCPVAVVQGRSRPLERVLVAVDESPASRAAVGFLSQFDLAAGIPVILLHVSLKNVHAATEPLLAEAESVLKARDCSVERMVVDGDAAQEIVRVARERDVDLVVLGARGLRTFGRLFLGSVSEAVLHHADRAVVIVRAR